MPSTAALLQQLCALAWKFGPESARAKLALLEALGARPLRTARQVRALHEVLCLWHAYPDDAAVFDAVTARLHAFGRRRDVRRHRAALENSGIAGTDIVYAFGAPTAQWLTATVPQALSIAWDRLEETGRLGRHLLLLARAAEVPGYDEPPIDDVRGWLRRLAGASSDAAFVVRGSAKLDAATLVRDAAYNELDLPVRIAAGRGTPTRSGARWAGHPTTFRATPVSHRRPDLSVEACRTPRAVRETSRREARQLIALAHEAMVTRERDLDAFASADPRDVRIVDWDEGLQFACIGVQPDRRFLLEAVYGFLTLRNRVPIGYALASALFGSSEIAYNVFETFRGGEAAQVYARLLATTRALFGSDTFAIYPYQLGHENGEGLQSGAWWFYYKLGFRPREASLEPLVAREVARVARRPAYRTPPSTLKRLVAHPLFYSLGPRRDDVIGVMPMGRLGLAVSDFVARRFGDDRVAADRLLAREARTRLGAGPDDGWDAGERLSWRRWAPLVAALPGLSRWTPAERRALVAIIRAKGGVREADAVPLMTAHARLRRSVAALMTGAKGRSNCGVLRHGQRARIMHEGVSMGVGAQLKEARTSRGLTVRDLADTTKISSRQIDAIESERYEKLPGGIFGRGYVRALAVALKLDADAIVAAYRDETEPERTALPAATEATEPPAGRRPRPLHVSAAWRTEHAEPRLRLAVDVVPSRTGSKLLAVVLIGLGVILLMLWFGRDWPGEPVSLSPTGAPRGPATSAVPSSPAPQASAGSERPVATVGQRSVEAPGPAGETDLLLVAERASWIELTVDGERVASRTMQPREAVHARMRSHARLRTGDAGALRLSIDGGAPESLGPPGAVRTLEIKPPGR